MFTGVPLGMQVAWLSWSNTGWPPTSTRVAPVIHWAVTQGKGLPAGVVNGQPATMCGAAKVTTGWPLTITRGLGAVAWA